MIGTLKKHWPEYLIEAVGLGLFMVSAGVFATLLEFPRSPVHLAIADPLVRRAVMGIIMGLTAVGLIYSPWGQRSGAHFNPAVTLTFWGLGKVAGWDALFYVVFQVLGGLIGVMLVLALLGERFALPPVSYVATIPGPTGPVVAFAAEVTIAFGLMLMVLITTNSRRLTRFTGLCAGLLLAFYITFESPLSGTSLNPARTLASGLPSGYLNDLWVYLLGPISGMALAAMLYRTVHSNSDVACAKLNHQTRHRCIFRNCRHHELMAEKL